MIRNLIFLIMLSIGTTNACAIAAVNSPESQRVTILIYGGTPSGISAAIAAAREGSKVLLVEPTKHLGGLITSGLCHADFRSHEGLTGNYLRFTKMIERYYTKKYGIDSQQVKDSRLGTHAEPHVNEYVFAQWLKKYPQISTITGASLKNVVVQEGRIVKVSFSSETNITYLISPLFVIDASYEGDLMAKAGVPYKVGREARSELQETLAPETADLQLQAYNFRTTMTKNPALKAPVIKPENYNRNQFQAILPLLGTPKISRIFHTSNAVFKAQSPMLPNDKYDVNDVSHSAIRLSMPGKNTGWPEGDLKTRKEIWQTHYNYHVGMLWFLQNDDEVPARFKKEALQYGWCKDEYTDHAHFPWQLYVREARRMQGVTIFSQKFTDQNPATEDFKNDARSLFVKNSIAMGDYGPNCHGTGHNGPLFGGKHTGEFYKRSAPYQIPYGSILPTQIENLLVPVACSSSHVGFCALRLEPIWMSLGEAAGIAAHLAHQHQSKTQDINPVEIRNLLHQHQAATIYVSDVLPGNPLFIPVQWIASLGGLHHLKHPLKIYGERGAHITGQYYEAFPNHDFSPQQKVTAPIYKKWTALISEAAQNRLKKVAYDWEQKTHAEFVTFLYNLQHEDQPTLIR